MAILKGNLTQMKGSVGALTYYEMNGKIVVREKAMPRSKPHHTVNQALSRSEMTNLVKTWGTMAEDPYLRPYFETKEMGQRDYNQFIAANRGKVPVFVPKAGSGFNPVIAAPYVITKGSLPTINTHVEQGTVVTDLALGELQITPETTVGEFAMALMNNNSQFDNHDEIVFFVGYQKERDDCPYVAYSSRAINLYYNSKSRLLQDDCCDLGFCNVDGFLGCSAPVQGALTWIHRRHKSDSLQVSSQQLTCTNDTYDLYSSIDKALETLDNYKADLKHSYFGESDLLYYLACEIEKKKQAIPTLYQKQEETEETAKTTEIEEITKSTESTEVTESAKSTDITESTEVTKAIEAKEPAEAERIIISAVPNNAEAGMVAGSGVYSKNQKITIIAVTLPGYTFREWSDGDKSPTRTLTAVRDLNLTALFDPV